MAVPLGILGAIYLNEYGKTGPPRPVLRFIADVMTGVPSIVMGLFIYTSGWCASASTASTASPARSRSPA